jgi:hypothetical protein
MMPLFRDIITFGAAKAVRSLLHGWGRLLHKKKRS